MRRDITTFPARGFSSVPGKRERIAVANPGAGVDWTVTFGSGYITRILTARALFTTSAVVANRFPRIIITDGSVNIWEGGMSTAVTASLTVRFGFAAGGPQRETITAQIASLIFLPDLYLDTGCQIQANTLGLDVGDTWTFVSLYVERMDYGALGEPMYRHEPTTDERWQTEPSRR